MGKTTPIWTKRWTRRNIERTYASLRHILQSRLAGASRKERLAFVQQQIVALANKTQPMQQMLRFAFVLEALRIQAAEGGLAAAQVARLAEIAYAILQTSGVLPEHSKIAFVYADLHLILSQIHRQNGEPLRAAWEQQVAAQLSKRSEPLQAAAPALQAGLTLLRLGHAALATASLESAATAGLPPAEQFRCHLAAASAAFQRGRADAVQTHLDRATELGIDQAEADWKRLLYRAVNDGDPTPLLAGIKKGGTFHEAQFILEGHLFAWATSSQQAIERATRIGALARRTELRLRHAGLLYRSALDLEDFYDATLPQLVRLNALGRSLNEAHHLLSIEHELLLWAAAARCLARHQSVQLAALALSRYRALCLGCSGGRTGDVFNVSGDLFQRTWFETAGVATGSLRDRAS